MSGGDEPRDILAVLIGGLQVGFNKLELLFDHFLGEKFGVEIKLSGEMYDVHESVIVAVVIGIGSGYRGISTVHIESSYFNPSLPDVDKVNETGAAKKAFSDQ